MMEDSLQVESIAQGGWGQDLADTRLEQRVLGALMLEPALLGEAAREGFSPATLTDPNHRRVLAAMTLVPPADL